MTIFIGNFHTQMSYLCSIGYDMKSSGVLELLSTTYPKKSVEK